MTQSHDQMSDITTSIKEIIVEILNGQLRVEDIGNDTPLFLNGLRLDSIDLLQLVPQIEKRFAIKIGLKNHNVLRTVNYLAEHILECIQNKQIITEVAHA